MSQKALFSATLGLSSPWKITSITYSDGEKKVDISIDFDVCSTFTCPVCGKTAQVCDTATETWQRCDFFRYSANIHVRVPLLSCPGGCGTCKGEAPWPREGTKFKLVE